MLEAIDAHIDSDLTPAQEVALARFAHDTPHQGVHMDTLPSRPVGNDVATNWPEARSMIASIFGVSPPDNALDCRRQRRRPSPPPSSPAVSPGRVSAVTLPIRVLHVVRPAAGGIRQHVLSLLNGLDPALITSSLAAPPGFLADLGAVRRLFASVPLPISATLSTSDLRAARRLAQVQPQFGDIVHAHGLRAAWVAALAHRRRPFPLIFTAHNTVECSLPSRLALTLISRRCKKIVAVSQAVSESLAACGVLPAKLQVIPNGVDIAYFASPANSRAEARAALAVPEAAFAVASAARFSPEKGMDVLLQAARQRKHMTFLLAGDGPQLAALSRDLPPNVRLLGRLDDIRPLLAAADVFAMPSRREGQGIAALEAMAAGVPVAASRVGGLAEMLADGETALLVPPDDPAALAAALSRLQGDSRLRRNLAQSASALVQSRYSLQTMLDSLTALYQEVAVR